MRLRQSIDSECAFAGTIEEERLGGWAPWVFAIDVDYCFSDAADVCELADEVNDAFAALALVMTPAG